jgi:chemotaxis protein histidine kinase CheA
MTITTTGINSKARAKEAKESKARAKEAKESKARAKTEKDAEKARAKTEKDAEKARAKAEKDAEKARAKAEKDAEKSRAKTEKDAEKSRAKTEKDAAKDAAKARARARAKTKRICPKNDIDIELSITDTEEPMSNSEYETTVGEIASIAKSISLAKNLQSDGDGRIDSAMKETPFLNEMKRIILERHPDWVVVISPPRASYDIMVNGIKINAKLTDCKSPDNSVSKPSIYYSITGLATYPNSSNWNGFLDRLGRAKTANQIKKQRHKPTEYHYLVKNKLTGDVLFKPIFDIHTYVSNPSNDLQIGWKNEFAHADYHTEDANYLEKVMELLGCIQKSVKEMRERTKQFAKADLRSMFD